MAKKRARRSAPKPRRISVSPNTPTRKNLPLDVQIQLGALEQTQQATLAQLDILRKTRGQRDVGSVKVPPHLRTGERVVLAARTADPRSCKSCGHGLTSHELSPAWRASAGQCCVQCYNSPSTDAGIELRGDISRNVLP